MLVFDNATLDSGINIIACLGPLLSFALASSLRGVGRRILSIAVVLPFALFGLLNLFLATKLPSGLVPYNVSTIATIYDGDYDVSIEKLDHGVLGEGFAVLQKRRVLPGLSITKWVDLAGIDSEAVPEMERIRDDRFEYRERVAPGERARPWRIVQLKPWLCW